MRRKTDYVKYFGLQIQLLLLLTNSGAVAIKVTGVTLSRLQRDASDGSLAENGQNFTTYDGLNFTTKDVISSEDSRHSSKRLQFDAKQPNATAHFHIYTGLCCTQRKCYGMSWLESFKFFEVFLNFRESLSQWCYACFKRAWFALHLQTWL